MSFLHRLARTGQRQEESGFPQSASGRSFRVDMQAAPEPRQDDPASTPAPEVIRQIADFPPHKDVLTNPHSPNISLRIPAEFQDMIIAVKLEATRACVALDPQFAQQVARYIPPIRSALGASGVWVHRTPLFAQASVIRAVRLNAERGTDSTSSLGGKSDGANLFRQWVTLAKDEKATDLHIRILDGGLAEVLMRVDGELEPITGSDRGLFTKLDALDAIKSAYEMLSDRHSNSSGTFSESEALSSMIDSALGIADVRLRFSCLRGLYGPKAVVRLLASSAAGNTMSFESMGFAPSHIELFERAHRLDCGAIGQMGITGSGKTTAARTFVAAHPKYGRSAMYQVADPIEYPMVHMHQIYVQRSLLMLNEKGEKDPYNVAIESLMRCDPDLVDVGEVRDILSARAMANVSKSGHLSMFALHVGSIAGAIDRLTDPHIGLTRQELTSGRLLGLLDYQALVPIVCPRCCMDRAGIVDFLHLAGDEQSLREARYIRYLTRIIHERFDIDPKHLRFRNLSGCEHCRQRGTTGLTICAEILMPDDDWLDLSAAGKDREAMRDWRLRFSDKNPVSENMNGKLVIEHALYKAYKGIIDPRNIERFGQLATLEILQ